MAHDLQVNQKMMKSALIKDLYFEMDRLLSQLLDAIIKIKGKNIFTVLLTLFGAILP